MTVRTSREVAVCFCALFALGAGRSVNAAATLTVDDRELEVEAFVSENGAGIQSGPELFTPDFGDPLGSTLFTPTLQSSPSGDAQASAEASQISSFDSSPVFTSITASGAANAFGRSDGFATFSSEADSSADSVFDIQFTIDSPQDWSITAMTDDEGSGSTARVRLRPVGGDNIYILQGENTTLNDTDNGTLQPGDYQLIGEARAAGFATSTGSSFYNRDAAFSFEFTIVPEPVSGMLVLLGAPLLLRRRSKR